MAQPAGQLAGAVAAEGDKAHPAFYKQCFSDMPSKDGLILMAEVEAAAAKETRHGHSLLSNLKGTDPGANGQGNATVLAQHQDRCEATREFMKSTVKKGSFLYQKVNGQNFTNGRQIYLYLKGPKITYLPPSQDEAENHKDSCLAVPVEVRLYVKPR